VDPGADRHLGGPQDRGADEDEARRHEGKADVQHEHESIRDGAIAGPSRQPDRLQDTAGNQNCARRGVPRCRHPGHQGQARNREACGIEA
jgi:hypothetical protein